MTDNQIPVHVIPTDQAADHLETMLERFRQGRREPLVFGDERTPEAAIIPFGDLLRLLRRDQADLDAEHAFQGEVSARRGGLEHDPEAGYDSVEFLARDLGITETDRAR